MEIDEKYALKPLFDILEAKLESKIEIKKYGSRPPLCYPLVEYDPCQSRRQIFVKNCVTGLKLNF